MLELFKTRLRAGICARRIPTCAHFHVYGQSDYAAQHAKWFLNCKENIHCSQIGQPSHAAVEGERRIVLHHEPNQKQLDDSAEGLRRSGRRRWFIIYEQRLTLSLYITF